MTLLGELLFPPADYRRTTLSTIAWWESRRGAYNLIVGGTGVFSLIAIRLITWLPPVAHFTPGWQPIAAYAVLANLCYTFGSGVEIVLRRALGERAPAIGPALFRHGLSFSVGLTLLPIGVVSIGWLVRVGQWLLR